jgi:hypothetical protein
MLQIALIPVYKLFDSGEPVRKDELALHVEGIEDGHGAHL